MLFELLYSEFSPVCVDLSLGVISICLCIQYSFKLILVIYHVRLKNVAKRVKESVLYTYKASRRRSVNLLSSVSHPQRSVRPLEAKSAGLAETVRYLTFKGCFRLI